MEIDTMSNHTNISAERVIITDPCTGQSERVTLPQPHWTDVARGPETLGTGVWATGLYVGPRTGRRFLRTESIWMRSHNDSRVVGTTYRELTVSEYLDVCRALGVEPVNVDATEV